MKVLIKYTWVRWSCVFFAGIGVLCPFAAAAQKIQRYQAVSAYIYNFAKNIEWQNETAIKEFHIRVIGGDQNIIRELKAVAAVKTLRNKPLRVSSSEDITAADNLHIIYLTKEKENLLPSLFDKIEGKNTLLISDGYMDKRPIMINFIESEQGTLRFEINRANILNQHLQVMDDMVLLGSTEVDVAALYRESQQSVRSLQKHTENLEQTLRKLEEAIDAKTQEIQAQKDSLAAQSVKIHDQKNIFDTQSRLLLKREADLDTLLRRVRGQQTILDEGNVLLREQKEKIEQQKMEIQQQSEILQERGETIQKQKNVVYWMITIILLVIGLALAVYTGYKNKQKLNTELEKRVGERTIELHKSNEQLSNELAERTRAESALKESEAHYRYLFEQNPVPMLIYELGSLQLLAVNDAFEAHYGYRKSEAASLHLPDLYPEQEKEPIANLSRKLQGQAYAGEWHHLKKDGTCMTIEAHSHGISFEGRNARMAVITDVTQRKHMEDALQKSEELYRTVFENTGTATVQIDETTIISLANAEFETLSQYSKKEIEGIKSWTEFVLEEDLKRMKEQHRMRREKGENALRQYEFRFVQRNGNVRNILLTIDLIPGTNKSVGSLLDVTERKKAEWKIQTLNEELEERVKVRTAQLEVSNKELEAFSYSVSHDLRAPLRHASGYVDLLMKKCRSDLPEKGQHYLLSINESVHQMGMLIDDLLQFSRTGRAELRQSTIEMNAIVQNVIETLRTECHDRSIEWIISALPAAFCDEAMIKLVWMNLLSNAVKFTRKNEKAIIEVGARMEEKEIVYFVRDNGVGFDMQYAQKLFGVFQRLHSMEEFEGTGIGLANVRRIISRHEGRTWAEAKLDHGAVFSFTLPIGKRRNNE